MLPGSGRVLITERSALFQTISSIANVVLRNPSEREQPKHQDRPVLLSKKAHTSWQANEALHDTKTTELR